MLKYGLQKTRFTGVVDNHMLETNIFWGVRRQNQSEHFYWIPGKIISFELTLIQRDLTSQ